MPYKVTFIYRLIMKLFITNKQQMEADLGDKSKDVHKAAFSSLSRSINVDNSIPTQIIKGDSMFSLVKAEIDKSLFVYSYQGTNQ